MNKIILGLLLALSIPAHSTDSTAFGEMSVASPTPIFQEMAVYGISSNMQAFSTGTGASATASNSMFITESGTDSFGFSFLGSDKTLNYRGARTRLARFTAVFGEPEIDNRQLAGLSTGGNGIIFGYDRQAKFGVLHRHSGINPANTLTISSGASGSENATVTVDGVGYTVALTSGTAAHNATEIAASLNTQVFLFNFDQIDNEVVSVGLRAEILVDTFSFSSSTAAASWANTTTGAGAVDEWTYFSQWDNYQKLKWLNPQKGNVYQIRTQFLGFGAIKYYVEHPETGEFILAHTIKYANTSTGTSFTNPSFSLGWSSSNFGNTESVILKGGSVAGFIEGMITFTREGHSETNTNASVSTTTVPILTIKSRSHFNQNLNQVLTYPSGITVASDSNKVTLITITKDAVLTGSNFDYHEKQNTPIIVDTSSTALSGGDVIATIVLAPGGSSNLDLKALNFSIRQTQALTVSASVVSGAVSSVTAGIFWQDDF